jgi:hypothetical protein
MVAPDRHSSAVAGKSGGGRAASRGCCPTPMAIVGYVAGILGAGGAELEVHLARCPECRVELEALRSAFAALSMRRS